MNSRKQEIYCELLYSAFTFLRAICWAGASNKQDEMGSAHESFRIAAETANLLHNVHLSILEPDFVRNDIAFINLGIPVYLGRLGDDVDSATAKLMIEFYNLVPESLRGELTWHPNASLHRLARNDRHLGEDSAERGPN